MERKIFIDIPKLKTDSCLIPGHLHLLFNFKVSNTKSTFMNNLAAILQRRFQTRLVGEIVCNNTSESKITCNKDFSRSKLQCSEMIEYGVTNSNLQKLISSDDQGATSGNSQKVSDALMYLIYSNKKKICSDKIIKDHGLYAPFMMNNNFRHIITLTLSEDSMVAQNNETIGKHSLENIKLETIENQDLANQVSSLYNSRSLSYEHITLMKTVLWGKNSTLMNENINIPCKSMQSILLLFTNTTIADSEEYIYPNITNVKILIKGVPNSIYCQGIPALSFYDEVKTLL